MTDEHKPDADSASTPKAPRTRRTSTPKKVAPKAAGKEISQEIAPVLDASASSTDTPDQKPKPRPRRKSPVKKDSAAASEVTKTEKTSVKKAEGATEQAEALVKKASPRPRKGVAKGVAKPTEATKTLVVDEVITASVSTDKTPSHALDKAGKSSITRSTDYSRAPRMSRALDESRVRDEIGETSVVPRPEKITPASEPLGGKEEQAPPVVAVPVLEDTSTENITDGSEENSDVPPRKSRRGRRGGRGRRGKGRGLAAAEVEITGTPEGEVSVPLVDEEITDAADDSVEFDESADLDDADDADADDADDAEGTGRGGRGKKTPKTAAVTARKGKFDPIESKIEPKVESKPGRRKMFISVVPGEQVEVALVEEGAIHEYYLEMLHQAKNKGNIYKGIVHNVDTNLQAAFVSYGAGKNGFLQIDEIHPEYYLAHHEPMKGKKFPPIQKVIKAGQEVLVQVVKEPTGNKGAFLTTWLSLPGRFLVLTPGQEQIGVSRKVDNDEERSRLREMMNGIEPGEGLGVIVRTVSAGTSKTTLKNDLQYLKRVWKEIRKRGTSETAPCLIYQESSLAERAVRDYLTDDVCEVWVDNESVAESLRETVALLFPRKDDLVRVHVDVRQTLWERFNIQRQLEQIYSREVVLPSGGRLVFDQTEALMAIDINSGKISGKGNFESMALKTNLEAAESIARHLKLRDIGGQVVIDFIEMRDKNHVREVEKVLRNAMKNDRARHDVARMSSFGLLEIVRQRTGSSALSITMEPCPCCGGTGIRRNMEWQALQALREIARQGRSAPQGKCAFDATAELGMYLLNHKRDRLREMEQQMQISIEIIIKP